jgi:ferric iron reductase protein FhuF
MSAAEPQAFAALVEGSPLLPLLERVWIGGAKTARHRDDKLVYVRVDQLAAERDRMLDAMVRRYGGEPSLHGRALLSQWSKFYFRLAAPAAIAAALTLGRPLGMAAERCSVALCDGMPDALYLPRDALDAPTTDPARRYRSFVYEHLQIVVEILSALVPMAPRVLWSNAGNLLDALLDAYRSDEASEQAALDAQWMFASERHPLHGSVRAMTPRSALLPTPFRARRVCCLRYEIPGERQLCGSCPLLLTMNDEQIAEQAAAD